MINSTTAVFMAQLARLIDSSGLPPCVVGLCLDSARAQVTRAEQMAIAKEEEQARKEAEAAPVEEGGTDGRDRDHPAVD